MMRYKKRGFGLFFLCLAFLLSGCSSLNTSEATRLVTNLWQARAGVPAPTAEKLAQVAHLLVTFENGANIYMALGRVNPDNSLTWVSSEGGVVDNFKLAPCQFGRLACQFRSGCYNRLTLSRPAHSTNLKPCLLLSR